MARRGRLCGPGANPASGKLHLGGARRFMRALFDVDDRPRRIRGCRLAPGIRTKKRTPRRQPVPGEAYARAADNLLALSLPLGQIIAQGRLREIPGVGEAIADIIQKLHATGTHPALEKMRKEIPAGVLEMLTIPGLRAEKVIKLYQELGLTSVEELEDAARQRKLQKVKGLGGSLQSKILRGLELRRQAQGRRHMHKADELLRTAEKHLRASAARNHPDHTSGRFPAGLGARGRPVPVAEVPKLPDGPKAITAGGQLTAHLTDAAHYGITLLLATGSDAHVTGLRAVAAERKLTLDEKGLRRGGKVVAAGTERGAWRDWRDEAGAVCGTVRSQGEAGGCPLYGNPTGWAAGAGACG